MKLYYLEILENEKDLSINFLLLNSKFILFHLLNQILIGYLSYLNTLKLLILNDLKALILNFMTLMTRYLLHLSYQESKILLLNHFLFLEFQIQWKIQYILFIIPILFSMENSFLLPTLIFIKILRFYQFFYQKFSKKYLQTFKFCE